MHEWTTSEIIAICSLIAIILTIPMVAVLAQIREELKKINKFLTRKDWL